jgi:hypothetical protein
MPRVRDAGDTIVGEAMKRRVFNLTAFVSLLVCFVTLALWVRSYRTGYEMRLYRWNVRFAVSSARGEFGFTYSSPYPVTDPTRDWYTWELDDEDTGSASGQKWHWLGFGFTPPSPALTAWFPGFTYFMTTAVAPAWAVIAVAFALPLIWFVQRRVPLKRTRTLTCRRCDYDLTANVSGVCPECGTPTSAGVKA